MTKKPRPLLFPPIGAIRIFRSSARRGNLSFRCWYVLKEDGEEGALKLHLCISLSAVPATCSNRKMARPVGAAAVPVVKDPPSPATPATPEQLAYQATADAQKDLVGVKRDLTTTLVPGSAGGGEKARVIEALGLARESIDKLTEKADDKDAMLRQISADVEDCVAKLAELTVKFGALQVKLRDISGR